MKKLFSSLAILSLLSACGTETISMDQVAPPNMTPSVSAQAKKTPPARKPLVRKNEVSTDTFSPFVKMAAGIGFDSEPSLQVFFKVTSKSGDEYDNSEEMMFPYQVFFDSESINETGNLRLGKDGIVYLEHQIRSNAMVIRDPEFEFFRMGTYQKKASIKSGDTVSLKLDSGNEIKMRWRMGEISREGIDIYVKPGLKEAAAKPELF